MNGSKIERFLFLDLVLSISEAKGADLAVKDGAFRLTGG